MCGCGCVYEFRTVMYCALTPRVHYLCRAVYGVGGAPHTVRRGGVGGVGVEACVVWRGACSVTCGDRFLIFIQMTWNDTRQTTIPVCILEYTETCTESSQE